LEPHLNGDRVKQFAEELHDLNAAHKLSGSDDKTRVKQIASVVTKILELDSESFNSSSIGVTNWLSPESIDFGYKVKLIDDADKAVLADAIAIAWNEGAIPLESTAAGLKRSALDSAAFYRNGSMIAQLFDGNTSSHINEFRASFAQHLYENYATPKAKLLSANELPHTLKTRDWDPSLFVANIVTGDEQDT